MFFRRLKSLETKLHSREPDEWERAIADLSRSRSAYAIQLLFDASQNASHPGRAAVLSAFSHSIGRHPRVALRHRNPSIREHAIELSASSRLAEAVPELSRILRRSGSEDLRCTIIDALGRIGLERCVAPLVEVQQDSSTRIRHAALEGLHRIPSATAEHGIVSALNDADWGIRLDACRLLQSSGWQPLTGPERAVWAVVNDRFDEAIRQGDGSTQTLLHTTLHADNGQTRRWAAIALSRVPGGTAQRDLRAALGSGQASVRQAASEALTLLGELPDSSAIWSGSSPRVVRPSPVSVFRAATRMLALVGEP